MTDGKAGAGRVVLLGALCLLPGLLLISAQVALLPSLLLFVTLWVLSLYDWISFRLPNLLTLTLFLTGAMYVAVTPDIDVWRHIIGAGVGLAFFPAVNALYKMLRGRDGVGLGDAKLMAGIGMWLGWDQLPPMLLIASISGILYGGCLALANRQAIATAKIPFGPFLCLGAWLAWLYLP